MQQAMLAISAAAAFAFAVQRWASDELERERRLSPAAAGAVLALGVLLTTIVVLASLGAVGSVDVPAALRMGAGAPLVVAGGALAIAAWRALGSRERVLAIRTDATVTSGPYRISRHPFYLGWTVFLVGVTLAGASALAAGVVFVIAIALLRLARGEERWLTDHLGTSYATYRDRAPAVLGRPRARA